MTNNLSWTSTITCQDYCILRPIIHTKSTLCHLHTLFVCIMFKQWPYCVEIWYFNPHFVSTHVPTVSKFLTPHSITQAGYSTFHPSRPPGEFPYEVHYKIPACLLRARSVKSITEVTHLTWWAPLPFFKFFWKRLPLSSKGHYFSATILWSGTKIAP